MDDELYFAKSIRRDGGTGNRRSTILALLSHHYCSWQMTYEL